MVDPAFDFDLPSIGERNWGDEVNTALSNIPTGIGAEDGDLKFLLKSGVEVNVGPLPPGPAGPAGGSDAATAEWIETGPETTAALSANYVREGEATVNVEKQAGASFAAKLQAAHDALATLFGGGTILVPGGTFSLDTTVNITAPVTVRGIGRTATTITLNAPRISAQASDVTFEDITFEAASDQWLLVTQTAAAEVGRWIFQRCNFHRVGLSLTTCDRPLGDGTTTPTGTRVGRGSVVRDCEFWGRTGNETLFIGGTIGVVVDSCYIHDCGTDENVGEGIKILHAASGTRVVNCLIERTTRDAIDAYNAIDTTIANNVFRDCGVWGIEIKWTLTETFNTRRTIVQGNRAERCGGGFNLDSPDTIATGNVAWDCTGAGFRFSTNADGGGTATASGTFVGNMANDCGGAGFTGSLATSALFIGNGAHNNGAIGFELTGPQTLIGNAASGNAANYAASGGQNNATFWGNAGASGSPYRLANNVPVMGYKADTNLYELMKVSTSGALNVGSAVTGAPPITFLVPSGSLFSFNARILPVSTATSDIGSATTRWKDGYLSGYLRAGTGLQTAAVATGSRPAAATAGAGCSVFDTTLGKPIWSDGTNWRDATGTVV